MQLKLERRSPTVAKLPRGPPIVAKKQLSRDSGGNSSITKAYRGPSLFSARAEPSNAGDAGESTPSPPMAPAAARCKPSPYN